MNQPTNWLKMCNLQCSISENGGFGMYNTLQHSRLRGHVPCPGNRGKRGCSSTTMQIPTHIDETDEETNPEDDSEGKIKKRTKIKEINLNPDMPEPTEESPKPNKTKNISSQRE